MSQNSDRVNGPALTWVACAALLVAWRLVSDPGTTVPANLQTGAATPAISSPQPLGPGEHRRLGPFLQSEVEVLSCDFVVANSTATPLMISHVQASCACLGAKLDSNTLLPGQNTRLHVEARAESFLAAPRAVTCTLVTDDGARSVFGFEARVYPAIDCRVEQVYLANVIPGRTSESAFTLQFHTRTGEPGLDSLRLLPDNQNVEMTTPNPPSISRPESGIERIEQSVRIRLLPSLLPTVRRSEVKVSATVGGREVEESLPIVWDWAREVDVQPDLIYLGKLRSDHPPLERSVQIRLHDGQQFSIRDASTSSDKITVLSTIPTEMQTSSTVVIRVDPRVDSRAFWGVVVLHVERADGSRDLTCEVPVSALIARE